MSKQQKPIDLSELAGTVAVVTGAGNNGIGWGLCKHLAGELGMHVVAVDLHKNLTDAAASRLNLDFPQVRSLGYACDVTQPEAMANCLRAIESAYPQTPIGAIFANAGVIFGHSVERSTQEEWATTMNVNVWGAVNTIQTFLPTLRRQQTPALLCTTASMAGLVRGDGGGAAYQASKHAVVALSESLSFELAARAPHIHVHVICPCIVASSLFQTSQTNVEVDSGRLDAADVAPTDIKTQGEAKVDEKGDGNGDRGGSPGILEWAMTVENHARQVFDHIKAGHFYVITDNVRPYVDHDFPFDGLGIIRERYENMLEMTLDNGDAFPTDSTPARSSIMKGPMFIEQQRRRNEKSKNS